MWCLMKCLSYQCMCNVYCDYPTHNLNMWNTSNTWIKLKKTIRNEIGWWYAENTKYEKSSWMLVYECAWHDWISSKNEWNSNVMMLNDLFWSLLRIQTKIMWINQVKHIIPNCEP